MGDPRLTLAKLMVFAKARISMETSFAVTNMKPRSHSLMFVSDTLLDRRLMATPPRKHLILLRRSLLQHRSRILLRRSLIQPVFSSSFSDVTLILDLVSRSCSASPLGRSDNAASRLRQCSMLNFMSLATSVQDVVPTASSAIPPITIVRSTRLTCLYLGQCQQLKHQQRRHLCHQLRRLQLKRQLRRRRQHRRLCHRRRHRQITNVWYAIGIALRKALGKTPTAMRRERPGPTNPNPTVRMYPTADATAMALVQAIA